MASSRTLSHCQRRFCASQAPGRREFSPGNIRPSTEGLPRRWGADRRRGLQSPGAAKHSASLHVAIAEVPILSTHLLALSGRRGLHWRSNATTTNHVDSLALDPGDHAKGKDSEEKTFQPEADLEKDDDVSAFGVELSDGESTDEEDVAENTLEVDPNMLARRAHQRALRAARDQRWRLARRLFGKAVTEFPDNARILTSAAVFEQKQGRYAVSRELFQRAVAVDPKNVVALQAWALMESRCRNPQWRRRVRSLFKEATSADPSHAPAWQAWAVFEWKQGRGVLARQLFEKATSANARHAPSWQAWALVESKAGQCEKARALFGKALEADPGHLPAIVAWARVEWGLRKVAKGRELFERGVKSAGKASLALLHDWARHEARSKHVGRARQLYRKAADLYPGAPQAWLLWGKLEQELQNYDRARELFTRGLHASHGDNEIMSHALAMLEKEAGNPDRAQRILAELVQRDRGNTRAWRSLADLCVRKGPPKWDRARECYQNAVELGPSQDKEGRAGTFVAWAQLEAMAGRNDTARTLFQRAVELAPGDAEHLRKWAQFEKKAGQEADVRGIFQKSIEAGPTARTYLLWGQWEKRLGNLEAATRCFESGISVDAENPFNYVALAAIHVEAGRVAEARDVYKAGTASCPTYTALWMEWALLEARQDGGEGIQRSRWLFARGSRLEPPHIPLLEAWATVEESVGDGRVAVKLRARVEEIEAQRRGAGIESSPVEIKSNEIRTDGYNVDIASREVVEGREMVDALSERRSSGGILTYRGIGAEVGQIERTQKVDNLIEFLLG